MSKIPHWTPQQLASYMAGRTGLVLLEYRHDDWCQAQRTQRLDDCTCDAEVYLTDHRRNVIARIVEPKAERTN